MERRAGMATPDRSRMNGPHVSNGQGSPRCLLRVRPDPYKTTIACPFRISAKDRQATTWLDFQNDDGIAFRQTQHEPSWKPISDSSRKASWSVRGPRGQDFSNWSARGSGPLVRGRALVLVAIVKGQEAVSRS